MKDAHYIMIGGFLGAGKSTALARLGQRFKETGQSVGLITNDQGAGLVDTLSLRAQGFSVEEIPGGCFCCRFNSLLEAAEALTAKTRPDVFLAEPVGSCTDLVATVSYPLRRIYGGNFRMAPFSVLVDPLRALRIFGLEGGRSFSRKVVYVYLKQLEEADSIVINKSDLLSDEQLSRLQHAMEEKYPEKNFFVISARSGTGFDVWFDHLVDNEQQWRTPIEVDYELYAEGEALLGWLNSTLQIEHPTGFDGNRWMQELAARLGRRTEAEGISVGHLKMTLLPEGGLADVGVVNLVGHDVVPELAQELSELVERAELVVNLRAEADPALLRRLFEEEIGDCRKQTGVKSNIKHLECFRPGKPVPTHRITKI